MLRSASQSMVLLTMACPIGTMQWRPSGAKPLTQWTPSLHTQKLHQKACNAMQITREVLQKRRPMGLRIAEHHAALRSHPYGI